MVLASGCWDRRELENLAVVLGMGLDLPAHGDGYEVVFQVVRAAQLWSPGSGGPGGGGGGEIKPVWILRSNGPTVFEAIRNATFQSSRRLFLSHNQVFIIGEKIAREGIFPAMEFLVRDHGPRNNQWLLLTPNDTAEILDAAAGLERVSALAIGDLVKDYHATSKIPPVRLFDYVETMRSRTMANTIPVITIKETAGKKELLIDGTGVVKEDRLVGYLDRTETRGLLWVLGKVAGGLITVDLPDGRKATFEIFNADSKLKVELREGKVHVKVEVKTMGFFKSTLCLYAMSVGTAQIFNLRTYRPLAIPFGVLLVLVARRIYPGLSEHLYYIGEVQPFVCSFFGFILPLLTLGTAFLRGRPKGEMLS